MKETTYFAIFEPTKTGYSVYFPDLLGCITCGNSFEDAKKQAVEVLGLHLWGMEKDGEEIPESTLPPFDDEMESGSFCVPISVYMSLVRNEMNNKAVKKTLTIPYWLNQLAEEKGINFSGVLQTALKEQLKVEV